MNYTISDKSLVILLNLAKTAGETQAYKEIISEMARRIKNELLRHGQLAYALDELQDTL
jgi:hypothetical protein